MNNEKSDNKSVEEDKKPMTREDYQNLHDNLSELIDAFKEVIEDSNK